MLARFGVFGSLFAAGIAALAGSASPAAAEGGNHIANEPAATLLLPYFEVALPKKPGAKGKGVTTIFTVSNADDDAVLAHVTIWSDLGVPVTFFDLYLTGFDTQTIDLYEVIEGRLPLTASIGQDPTDEISPQGPVSGEINFASCTGQLPQPPQLPLESVEHLRTSLTGKPSPLFANFCLGRDYGEKKPIARGYVTVETVNSCSLLFPDQFFFSGIATDQNVLFGDYVILDRGKKTAYGDALVHVRADAAEFAPGDYTFYARKTGNTSSDHRQPLATNFGARFVIDPKDPVFPGGTDVIAWRDVKLDQNPFNCASGPAFFPLGQEQIVVFDEEENAEIPTLPAIPPLPPEFAFPFPAATQKVKVGTDEFPVSFPRGWLFLNLNTALVNPIPAVDPAAAQAFVTTVRSTKRHPVATRATAFDHANDANHVFIPVP